MNTHPADEQIVEYLDGTLGLAIERDVNAHLGDCADCRLRLADLAEFDTFMQSHQPADEVATAAMFAISERVLRAARPGRRWSALATMLAAALLLVTGALWAFSASDAEDLGTRITRYVPDGALRSMPPERFHLDVHLGEPAFVAVFARFADGKVVQLLPAGPADPSPRGPSPRGAVRLPENELLDWEYPADHMPVAVLVVACAVVPDGPALADLGTGWSKVAADQLPPAATVEGRRAELVPFPAPR